MSTATKHERRHKRFKIRLKEIKSACEVFERMGIDPQSFRADALKRAHFKLNRRGRGSGTSHR